MTMVCKGICECLKAGKPSDPTTGRYLSGQKRCQTCMLFLRWDALNCPCCGSRLRTRPRNSLNRRTLRLIKSSQHQDFWSNHQHNADPATLEYHFGDTPTFGVMESGRRREDGETVMPSSRGGGGGGMFPSQSSTHP
jgi:hypothetical protein